MWLRFPPHSIRRHVDNAVPERGVYAYVSVDCPHFLSVDNAVPEQVVHVSTLFLGGKRRRKLSGGI